MLLESMLLAPLGIYSVRIYIARMTSKRINSASKKISGKTIKAIPLSEPAVFGDGLSLYENAAFNSYTVEVAKADGS